MCASPCQSLACLLDRARQPFANMLGLHFGTRLAYPTLGTKQTMVFSYA